MMVDKKVLTLGGALNKDFYLPKCHYTETDIRSSYFKQFQFQL